MRGLAAFVTAAAVVSGWSSVEAADATLEPFGPNWSIAENQPCQVWNYGKKERYEPYIWSGACADGKATGEGRLTVAGREIVYDGAMLAGKFHGRGTDTFADGSAVTCEWRDNELVDGTCGSH